MKDSRHHARYRCTDDEGNPLIQRKYRVCRTLTIEKRCPLLARAT
ncbi:hypothetical protein [Xenorhabdus bovienii]|nr:hypothetical protein [Xenorhabdus bovienii]